MRTGILQHRRLRPNTEQDVPQKPSNKPEPKEKHTEKKHGSCENPIFACSETAQSHAKCKLGQKSISVCRHANSILTSSTAACSSALGSSVMPVQNKEYLTRGRCMTHTAPPTPPPREVRTSWTRFCSPGMEKPGRRLVVLAQGAAGREEERTRCLLWGCYFHRINRLKSGQG